MRACQKKRMPMDVWRGTSEASSRHVGINYSKSDTTGEPAGDKGKANMNRCFIRRISQELRQIGILQTPHHDASGGLRFLTVLQDGIVAVDEKSPS